VLLGITWSFRNTGAKLGSARRAPGAARRVDQGHDTDGHRH